MRRFLLAAGVSLTLSGTAHSGTAQAQPAGDPVRTLTLLALPQAASPQEYTAAELVAQSWKDLGLDVVVRPLPGQQFNQIVWY